MRLFEDIRGLVNGPNHALTIRPVSFAIHQLVLESKVGGQDERSILKEGTFFECVDFLAAVANTFRPPSNLDG